MPQRPINKEIKQLSGFATAKELRDALPNDPDVGGVENAKRKRAPRQPRAANARGTAPDLMEDARYAQACANMTAFGGKRLIVRGFDAGAKALEDPTFSLSNDEEKVWDDFFYVLSKKPLFDVGKPWFLALFFVVTLFSQLGWRVFERTNLPILEELFPNEQKRRERDLANAVTEGEQ